MQEASPPALSPFQIGPDLLSAIKSVDFLVTLSILVLPACPSHETLCFQVAFPWMH